MGRTIIVLTFLFFVFVNACNNPADENADNSKKTETQQTPADSLMKDVEDGHNVGMSKMGKLSAMRQKVKHTIDSIELLPAKTKKALALYKIKLDRVLEDLKSAKAGMEKWMDEFNMDSAVNNMEQRIKYLTEEKLKVSKVKENILTSLQKADSLIKQKF
jgi:transcriptional regulator NrdR family protein